MMVKEAMAYIEESVEFDGELPRDTKLRDDQAMVFST